MQFYHTPRAAPYAADLPLSGHFFALVRTLNSTSISSPFLVALWPLFGPEKQPKMGKCSLKSGTGDAPRIVLENVCVQTPPKGAFLVFCAGGASKIEDLTVCENVEKRGPQGLPFAS